MYTHTHTHRYSTFNLSYVQELRRANEFKNKQQVLKSVLNHSVNGHTFSTHQHNLVRWLMALPSLCFFYCAISDTDKWPVVYPKYLHMAAIFLSNTNSLQNKHILNCVLSINNGINNNDRHKGKSSVLQLFKVRCKTNPFPISISRYHNYDPVCRCNNLHLVSAIVYYKFY